MLHSGNRLPDTQVVDLSTTKPLLYSPFEGVIDYRACLANGEREGTTVNGGSPLRHPIFVEYENEGQQRLTLWPGEVLKLDPDLVSRVRVFWGAPDASIATTYAGGNPAYGPAGAPDAGKAHLAVITHGARTAYEITR